MELEENTRIQELEDAHIVGYHAGYICGIESSLRAMRAHRATFKSAISAVRRLKAKATVKLDNCVSKTILKYVKKVI